MTLWATYASYSHHLHQCCLEQWVSQQHAASPLQQRLNEQRPQPHAALLLMLLQLLRYVQLVQLAQAGAAGVAAGAAAMCSSVRGEASSRC